MQKQNEPKVLNKNRAKPPFKNQHLTPPGIEERMSEKPEFMNEEYKGSEKLKGKVALITGGDSGIGRSVAVLFAREGADVVITCLPEEVEDAEVTVRAIEQEGQRGLYIPLHVEILEECQGVVDEVIEQFGRVDILVNNAAFQNHVETFEDLSPEQFEHTFRVNIFGPFNMVKATLPFIPEGGTIVNTASILAYEASKGLIDYSSTKGALRAFTKALAQDLIKKSIRVNAVAPGPVWTPLNPAERKAEDVKDFGKETLFKRPAQPEEIAPAFVYLASNITASYITGETINIFGDVSGN